MHAPPSIESLIEKVSALGFILPDGPVYADGFGDSAELSEELIELVAKGQKHAGTGLLWAFEVDQQPLPEVGSIEITVDHLNEPVLITRNTSVEVVPFNEVSAEYASIEGEGDGSLEHWRKGHWAYFGRECARIGREPTESMPVVCCVFELLYVLPRKSVA